jgi:hypothetical protein
MVASSFMIKIIWCGDFSLKFSKFRVGTEIKLYKKISIDSSSLEESDLFYWSLYSRAPFLLCSGIEF